MNDVYRHRTVCSYPKTPCVHNWGLAVNGLPYFPVAVFRVLYGAIMQIMGPEIWGLLMPWGYLLRSYRVIETHKPASRCSPLASLTIPGRLL